MKAAGIGRQVRPNGASPNCICCAVFSQVDKQAPCNHSTPQLATTMSGLLPQGSAYIIGVGDYQVPSGRSLIIRPPGNDSSIATANFASNAAMAAAAVEMLKMASEGSPMEALVQVFAASFHLKEKKKKSVKVVEDLVSPEASPAKSAKTPGSAKSVASDDTAESTGSPGSDDSSAAERDERRDSIHSVDWDAEIKKHEAMKKKYGIKSKKKVVKRVKDDDDDEWDYEPEASQELRF